jgi:hypothetical protein
VPAHNPDYILPAYSALNKHDIEEKCENDPDEVMCKQRKLGERDEFVFYTLYKLYKMSLVDTSKLVTPPPAVTITIEACIL